MNNDFNPFFYYAGNIMRPLHDTITSKPFFLIIIVALSSILSLAATAQVPEEMPVIILNDSNKEPFTTKNRDGFLDIILTEAFRRIGFRLNTVHLPPERGLLSANEGIVDGEVNRIIGLDKIYKNLRRVPEKVRNSEFCALSKNPAIVNTVDELNKQVVGHIKGWKIYEKMMVGSERVITANSPQQLFRLLKKNRIDVALYDCVEGLDLAQRFNIKTLYMLEPAFDQTELFLYLNKHYADLVPRLSKALNDIKEEGFYDELYREKILPYYENREKSRQLIQ